jgi:hypothetical protein
MEQKLSDARQIVSVAEREILKSATKEIREDIKTIFLAEEQFDSSDPEIGASLAGVEPLAPRTIAIKRAGGYPMTPRVRTGMLMNSIADYYGELDAEVFVAGSEEKARVQQEGEGRTIARPFFGVSGRALANIETNLQAQGEKLIAQLNSLQWTEQVTV